MASKAFLPRRGRKSTSVSKNFILRKGELFIEVPEEGCGTGPIKIKIGDGIHEYSDLPYAIDLKDAISPEHLSETLSKTEVSFTQVSIPDGEGSVNEKILGLLVDGKSVGEVLGCIKMLLENLDTAVTKLNNDKAPKDHSATTGKYGVASGSKYGHVKISGDITKKENVADDIALSTKAFAEFNKVVLEDKEETGQNILNINEAIKKNAENIIETKKKLSELIEKHNELVDDVANIEDIKEDFDRFVESTNERFDAKDKFDSDFANGHVNLETLLEDGTQLLLEDGNVLLIDRELAYSYDINELKDTIKQLQKDKEVLTTRLQAQEDSSREELSQIHEMLENGEVPFNILLEGGYNLLAEDGSEIIGERHIVYSEDLDKAQNEKINHLTNLVSVLRQDMNRVIEQNVALFQMLVEGIVTNNLLLDSGGSKLLAENGSEILSESYLIKADSPELRDLLSVVQW